MKVLVLILFMAIGGIIVYHLEEKEQEEKE